NVGKSTLFNRLVGKKIAIVDDRPGVTRDRREAQGSVGDLDFTVIDTAGLETAKDGLESRMHAQTEQALDDADIALFMIDARAGVTPLDKHFADILRSHTTPVSLIANKCEGRAADPGLMESYGLGLGDPTPLSAEHGEGMADIYSILLPFENVEEEEWPEDTYSESTDDEEYDEEKMAEEDAAVLASPLSLAIVGRPNAGKSTLVNRLLGEDRVLTGPEAGITRDSISSSWTSRYQGNDRAIKLVDTAGIRRRARVTDKIEHLSIADTMRTIQFAQVVVLLIDAEEGLEKQDLFIAGKVIDEGRALVIAINKWDTVKDKAVAMKQVEDRLQTSLTQVRGIPVITFSALTGKGINRLMPAVFKIFDTWNIRISTARLNKWLSFMTEAHTPPAVNGRHIRLRYATQAKTRPPTFAVFSSRAEKLPTSYMRYLVNGLREDFDLDGIPIRLNMRKGDNPYAKKRK
ncbi:MAG: ribosome biogenesis GTPase Der, partial [Rhodospirillales bacterium]|nr:ribosome biogenesis GTPase Der [Rhodospirillales bacterium]